MSRANKRFLTIDSPPVLPPALRSACDNADGDVMLTSDEARALHDFDAALIAWKQLADATVSANNIAARNCALDADQVTASKLQVRNFA